jgi:hypothetical protein
MKRKEYELMFESWRQFTGEKVALSGKVTK